MGSDPLKKWLATKGIVIGLCAGLPVLVALMVFGVNAITVFALVICGILIAGGILAFSAVDTRRAPQTGKERGEE